MRTFHRPCLQNRIYEYAPQVLPLLSLAALRRNDPDQISNVARKTCGGGNDLLNHVVSDGEHSRRNDEAKSLGGVEIDNQLELGELHDWQI